jgi:hypothetical protein
MTNTIIIQLPGRPSDDLNWAKQEDLAKRRVESGAKILWEFDLGLNTPYFPLEDELRFQTLARALGAFQTQFWPRFLESTTGAILYRGPADLNQFFHWSARQSENWKEWKEERPETEEKHLRRLFCLEAFVSYFQMLAHRLPDELPLILRLDFGGLGTPAEIFHLSLPERFEHFLLEIEGISRQAKARLGVCFPHDLRCSSSILARLNTLFQRLKIPFKPISESLMTELWGGLDFLYVLSDTVSAQGRRKLMGFSAAGGTVICEGAMLGIPNEISALEFEEKFGAEGFEPPAYWSQTSRASQTALCPDK